MAVPEHIRKVERPVNTVVVDTHREGMNRYAVRERNGYKKIASSKYSQPINGRTIGHIRDGAYYPITIFDSQNVNAEYLSFGGAKLVDSVTSDLFHDLAMTFGLDAANSLLNAACIQVLYPNKPLDRVLTSYKKSYLSTFKPGAALSANTLRKLFNDIGCTPSKREEFFGRRLAQVCKDHHIAIDGMLKQDNSKVNDLSAYSYKSRIRNVKDISVLYAYDIETKEPVCAEVFPGNCVDSSSYRHFIRDNKITKGIIIADKGFPVTQIKEELKANPDLHYLSPLKRNDKRISEHNMLKFNQVVNGGDQDILAKKKPLDNGTFLYAFQNGKTAFRERTGFLKMARQKGEFDEDAYEEKKDGFGTIVFVSDLDMDLATVYSCYQDRWKIEMIFKAYKSNLELVTTNVQEDFTVIGSEFVNFISEVITCRILNKFRDAGLLETMSYGEILEELNMAWRRCRKDDDPIQNDGYWVHTTNEAAEIMVKLGLIKKDPAIQKMEEARAKKEERRKQIAEEKANKPKRPVGRPRKVKTAEDSQPKRPRGRPRVRPMKDPNAPKRPVGRPRKNPLV